jgi:hypothetical protein
MQSINLRCHVGAEGMLHLDIPMTMTHTDCNVMVWVQPIITADQHQKPTFSEKWQGKFADITANSGEVRDLKYEYLAEKYKL